MAAAYLSRIREIPKAIWNDPPFPDAADDANYLGMWLLLIQIVADGRVVNVDSLCHLKTSTIPSRLMG